MSEVDDRKQLQVLVNRINAVGISVFGAQGWEALREPKAERCLDCGRTDARCDRVIDSRDAEVDDRKAADDDKPIWQDAWRKFQSPLLDLTEKRPMPSIFETFIAGYWAALADAVVPDSDDEVTPYV